MASTMPAEEVSKSDDETRPRERKNIEDKNDQIQRDMISLENEITVRKILQKKWLLMNTIETFLISACETYYDVDRECLIDERLLRVLKRQNQTRNNVSSTKIELKTTTKNYDKLLVIGKRALNEILHRLDDVRRDVKKIIDLQSIVSLTTNPIRENINQLIHAYEVLMKI